MMSSAIRVIIVGGGGTGAATAYDCTLRGYRVLLLEKGSFTSGTTGRHHGLLHSGARYVVDDLAAAKECWQEAQVLRRITTGVIEDNGGYFLGLAGMDAPQYAAQFADGCRQAGIPACEVELAEVSAAVPGVSDRVQRAYSVPDASFDAWRLPMQFFTAALAHGAVIRQFCEVIDIERHGGKNGAVKAVRYIDHAKQCERRASCDIVVNAAGVWAGRVASLCSLSVDVHAQAGTMVSVRGRLCNHVLNRLAPAGDGDIIVPQREQTIIGTTGYACEDIDAIESASDEVEYLQRRADELLPGFSERPIRAVWAAARPLAGTQSNAPRKISRKLVCYDHSEDGVPGMFSIIGGKATTLRAMAEGLVDRIDAYSERRDSRCTTAEKMLPPFQQFYAYHGSAEHQKAASEWD